MPELVLPIPPAARELIGERGCDGTWFRAALAGRRITPRIPSIRAREGTLPGARVLCPQRHRIGNALGRPKDRGRVAARHDRCART